MLLALTLLFASTNAAFGIFNGRQQIQDIVLQFEYLTIDITEETLVEFLADNLTEEFAIQFGPFAVEGRDDAIAFYLDELSANKRVASVVGALYVESFHLKSRVVRKTDLVTQQKLDDSVVEFQVKNFWTFERDGLTFKLNNYQTDILFAILSENYNVDNVSK